MPEVYLERILAPECRTEWQPIDTAPKQWFTEIDLWLAREGGSGVGLRLTRCMWHSDPDEGEPRWIVHWINGPNEDATDYGAPTHWKLGDDGPGRPALLSWNEMFEAKEAWFADEPSSAEQTA